eukprot:COSAG01_NODE_721_length_14068_cov_479.648436_3_plen_1328_part_00
MVRDFRSYWYSFCINHTYASPAMLSASADCAAGMVYLSELKQGLATCCAPEINIIQSSKMQWQILECMEHTYAAERMVLQLRSLTVESDDISLMSARYIDVRGILSIEGIRRTHRSAVAYCYQLQSADLLRAMNEVLSASLQYHDVREITSKVIKLKKALGLSLLEAATQLKQWSFELYVPDVGAKSETQLMTQFSKYGKCSRVTITRRSKDGDDTSYARVTMVEKKGMDAALHAEPRVTRFEPRPEDVLHREPTREDITRMFSDWDVSGDGSLDREEIAALAKALGHHLSDSQLNEAMAQMDRDSEGGVSLDEFQGWFETQRADNSLLRRSTTRGILESYVKQLQEAESVLVKLTGSAVQAAKRDRRVADDNPDNRTITLMETKETSMQMNSDVTSAERIKQQVRLAFQEFDKDGSKSLEKPEVAALLKQLGQQLSDQELDKAMAAMDTEGARDNKIELSEFEIWFEERQTSRFQILRAGVEFEARRIVGSDKPINIQVQQDQSNLRTSQRMWRSECRVIDSSSTVSSLIDIEISNRTVTFTGLMEKAELTVVVENTDTGNASLEQLKKFRAALAEQAEAELIEFVSEDKFQGEDRRGKLVTNKGEASWIQFVQDNKHIFQKKDLRTTHTNNAAQRILAWQLLETAVSKWQANFRGHRAKLQKAAELLADQYTETRLSYAAWSSVLLRYLRVYVDTDKLDEGKHFVHDILKVRKHLNATADNEEEMARFRGGGLEKHDNLTVRKRRENKLAMLAGVEDTLSNDFLDMMFSGAGITDLQKSNIMHAAQKLMKKMPPLESGDRVLTKGDQCIALYFVGEGEVEVVREDSRVIAKMGKGQMFGERALLKMKRKRTPKEIEDHFNAMDIDGDKSLDEEEIGALAKVLGMHLSQSQLNEAMKQMDADGSDADGCVSLAEFQSWFEGEASAIFEATMLHSIRAKGTTRLYMLTIDDLRACFTKVFPKFKSLEDLSEGESAFEASLSILDASRTASFPQLLMSRDVITDKMQTLRETLHNWNELIMMLDMNSSGAINPRELRCSLMAFGAMGLVAERIELNPLNESNWPWTKYHTEEHTEEYTMLSNRRVGDEIVNYPIRNEKGNAILLGNEPVVFENDRGAWALTLEFQLDAILTKKEKPREFQQFNVLCSSYRRNAIVAELIRTDTAEAEGGSTAGPAIPKEAKIKLFFAHCSTFINPREMHRKLEAASADAHNVIAEFEIQPEEWYYLQIQGEHAYASDSFDGDNVTRLSDDGNDDGFLKYVRLSLRVDCLGQGHAQGKVKPREGHFGHKYGTVCTDSLVIRADFKDIFCIGNVFDTTCTASATLLWQPA